MSSGSRLSHGLTGTNRKRPGLDQALAAVRAGDTLVVPKLDRRSATQALRQAANRTAAHARHRRLLHRRPRRTLQHLPAHRVPDAPMANRLRTLTGSSWEYVHPHLSESLILRWKLRRPPFLRGFTRTEGCSARTQGCRGLVPAGGPWVRGEEPGSQTCANERGSCRPGRRAGCGYAALLPDAVTE